MSDMADREIVRKLEEIKDAVDRIDRRLRSLGIGVEYQEGD